MPCLQSASTWSSCGHNSKSQILKEHVSDLDSSFHSVLSLPSDVPLHFHFETLFKKTEVKGDLAENKFVGDCIISPSPGMSLTNLVLIYRLHLSYTIFAF